MSAEEIQRNCEGRMVKTSIDKSKVATFVFFFSFNYALHIFERQALFSPRTSSEGLTDLKLRSTSVCPSEERNS